MKYFVFVAFVLAVAAAMPFDLIEDEDGQQYYAVPVSREKRQTTKYGASETGFGASHQGTIWSNNNHQLDGTGSFSKGWKSHGLLPDQYGGNLDYLHKPSGASAFVGADHTRHYGTDLSAGLKYNLHHSRDLDLNVGGKYSQHVGGPGGRGEPNFGAFVEGRF